MSYSDLTFYLNRTVFCLFQYQLASARAPLQAKIEDMEDAIERLQDKFNKVKAENDRVSFLFISRESRHTKVIYRNDYVQKNARQ